jgi:hypothetical protein
MTEPETDLDETYFVRQDQQDGLFDESDRPPEAEPGNCLGFITRGNARYHKGDPNCVADFQAAFLLDAELAAIEIVRRLEDDIRHHIGHVLVTCWKRLNANSHDFFARTRLGLALLMLSQESAAFQELQQVFLESADWRPFLRLMVKEAKRRSTRVFARAIQLP